MKVIGIDIGPAKGIQSFDGENDQAIPPEGCRDYLTGLKKNKSLLICWDAPLTGPPQSIVDLKSPIIKEDIRSAFTKRQIERSFGDTPKGISLLGYSGCSHWTITRSLVGLPRVGPYDQDYGGLPYQLLSSQKMKPNIGAKGHFIAEVHPALALWLWCNKKENMGWEYKKDSEQLKALWKVLSSTKSLKSLLNSKDIPSNDDVMDARIAYALGQLWIHGNDEVRLYGNLDRGAFLLPSNQQLPDGWVIG